MEEDKNESKPKGRRDAEAQLVARAWKDDAFRALLLSDPKKAIQEELGIEIPEEIEVVVSADTESVIHIVLPVQPTPDVPAQLTDEDLEAVAGGHEEMASGLIRVDKIYSTNTAFALLNRDEKIVSWGEAPEPLEPPENPTRRRCDE